MDFHKTSEWAEMLAAAAHPVRLMILAELLEGPKCVTTIRELLEARQPNVSQVLKHSGLVAFIQDGAFRCYYLLRPAQVKAIFRLLESDYPTVGEEEIQRKFHRVRQRKAAGQKKSPPGLEA